MRELIPFDLRVGED